MPRTRTNARRPVAHLLVAPHVAISAAAENRRFSMRELGGQPSAARWRHDALGVRGVAQAERGGQAEGQAEAERHRLAVQQPPP